MSRVEALLKSIGIYQLHIPPNRVYLLKVNIHVDLEVYLNLLHKIACEDCSVLALSVILDLHSINLWISASSDIAKLLEFFMGMTLFVYCGMYASLVTIVRTKVICESDACKLCNAMLILLCCVNGIHYLCIYSNGKKQKYLL